MHISMPRASTSTFTKSSCADHLTIDHGGRLDRHELVEPIIAIGVSELDAYVAERVRT